MARMIGPGPGRPAANAARPAAQLSRALGGPQPRAAAGQTGGAGRVHRDPNGARSRAQAQSMLLNRQRQSMQSMGSVGGSTIDVQRYFGEASGRGQTGNPKCSDCGTDLIAGYDAMGNPDGPGVLCKNCWADMWVPHAHGNISGLGGNTCTMGVRWTPQEWQAIQGFAMTAINNAAVALGRYPTPADYPNIKGPLDQELGKHFKKSMKCNTCQADVSFHPTSDDIPMAGINAPVQ